MAFTAQGTNTSEPKFGDLKLTLQFLPFSLILFNNTVKENILSRLR